MFNMCQPLQRTYAKQRGCVFHLNYREYAEQRGTLVLIHRGWCNKTEAFEELVGISTGRDTWGV